MKKDKKNIKKEVIRLAKTGLATSYIAVQAGISEKKLLKDYRNELNLGRSEIWLDNYPELLDKITDDANYLRMLMPIISPELSTSESESESNQKVTVIIK